MKLRYFVIFLFFLSQHISGQNPNDSNDSLFILYKNLNEAEERLAEYKDDSASLQEKILQLNLINQSRKRYRRTSLQLDIFASRLANKISKEAAENGYTSHWNLKGETPYHKYAFAGGMDHVSENAYGIRTNKRFEFGLQKIREFMREGHLSFMKERKPNDGHKQTIIEKQHNYVGIGFYMTEKQFNYYELFIDRYLEFVNVPSVVRPNESFSVKLRTPDDQFIFFVAVTMDEFPKPKSPATLNRLGTYCDFGKREITNIKPWELSKMHNDNTYSLNFTFKKAGLYYLHVFLSNREITKPASFDTRRLIQASGIIISVKD